MSWFTNLKISVKLLISYLILCLLMLAVGGAGFYGLKVVNKNIHSLYDDSLVGISDIKEAMANIEHVRLLLQRYVLPDYKTKLSTLNTEIGNYGQSTDNLLKQYESGITYPEDRVMFQEAQRLLSVAREKRTNVMNMINREEYAAAGEYYVSQVIPANDAVSTQLQKICVWNDNLAKTYMHEAEISYDNAITMMLSLIVCSLILIIILCYFITRSIVSPLNSLVEVSSEIAGGNLTRKIEANRQDEIGSLEEAVKKMVVNLRDIISTIQSNADNMAASSEELTASADQSAQAANSVATSIMGVAQGAERQVHIAGESVNTAEKMSAEAEQISANADIVATSSDKTAQSAQTGRKAVETAINQMASIQKTVENLAQEITGLGMRSKEIGQIVETISSISSQTNLLALNAAIEAARAGEQGRGFAVVAEEVRKLAEQSQDAAKQIASLIGVIQDDTNKAVQAMESGTREVKVGADLVNSAGAAFEEIAGLIDQTTREVKEISESIRQMAADSQTIVSGAQEINVVSQETSSQTQSVSAATEEQLASMQEIASASQALSKRAEELQTVTQRFVM